MFPVGPTVGQVYENSQNERWVFTADSAWKLQPASVVYELEIVAPIGGTVITSNPAQTMGAPNLGVLLNATQIVDFAAPATTVTDPFSMIAGSVITIPTSGVWFISAQFDIQHTAVGGSGGVQLVLNGATVLGSGGLTAGNDVPVVPAPFTVLRPFTQGDSLDFRFADNQAAADASIRSWHIAMRNIV